MDEQGLRGAADAGAAHLGVDDDLHRLVEVGRPVDVDVHDALEMGEDRHARLALHPLDQALAAARHDDVERSAEALEHLADGGARGERRARDRRFRQPGLPQPRDQAGVDRRRRVETVRAAAQHDGVAALQAERAGVRGDVRAALVDDAHDAERRRDPLDDEAVGAVEGREHAADRIGQRRDVLEAAGDRLDPRLVQREAIEERRRQALRLAFGEVARVGGQDFRRAFAQNSRRRRQRPVLLRGRRIGEGARGRPRLGADGAHRGADFRFGLESLNGGGHERAPVERS